MIRGRRCRDHVGRLIGHSFSGALVSSYLRILRFNLDMASSTPRARLEAPSYKSAQDRALSGSILPSEMRELTIMFLIRHSADLELFADENELITDVDWRSRRVVRHVR